jgi:uncharacterized membrane protein YccC
MSLYLIATEYRQALDTLAESDLDPQTLADTLEGLDGELQPKLIAVAMWARNVDADADAIEAAAKAMQDRAKALRAKAERTRAYLLQCMQLAGVERISSPHVVLSVRANPASVEIEDEAQIPAAYMTDPKPVPPKPDKALIKRALQDGHEVPGARLARGVRLEIKQ